MSEEMKLSENETVLGQFMGFILTEKRIMLSNKKSVEILFLKHVEYVSLEIAYRDFLLVLGILLALLGIVVGSDAVHKTINLSRFLIISGAASIIAYFVTRKQYLTFGSGSQKLKTMINTNKKTEAINFINLVTSKISK